MFAQQCMVGEHNSVLDPSCTPCRLVPVEQHMLALYFREEEVEKNHLPFSIAYKGIEYSIRCGSEVLPWFRVFIPVWVL